MADVRNADAGAGARAGQGNHQAPILESSTRGRRGSGMGFGDGLSARVLEDDSRCSQRPSRSGGGDGDGGQD